MRVLLSCAALALLTSPLLLQAQEKTRPRTSPKPAPRVVMAPTPAPAVTVKNVRGHGVTIFAWPYASPPPAGSSRRPTYVPVPIPAATSYSSYFNSPFSPMYAIEHPGDYGSSSVVYDAQTASYRVLNPVTGTYSRAFAQR